MGRLVYVSHISSLGLALAGLERPVTRGCCARGSGRKGRSRELATITLTVQTCDHQLIRSINSFSFNASFTLVLMVFAFVFYFTVFVCLFSILLYIYIPVIAYVVCQYRTKMHNFPNVQIINSRSIVCLY